MVHRFIGGIAAVLLLLASCGESASPQAEPTDALPPAAAFPITITDDDGIEVTIDAEPQRTARPRRTRPRTVSRRGRRHRRANGHGATHAASLPR